MIKPIEENIELLENLLKKHLKGFVQFSEKDDNVEIDNGFICFKMIQVTDGFSGYSSNIRMLLPELMLITKKTQSNEIELHYNWENDFVDVSIKEAGVYTLETV